MGMGNVLVLRRRRKMRAGAGRERKPRFRMYFGIAFILAGLGLMLASLGNNVF